MELLIAMTLTSIITVTIAISFSISIRAWERGEETTFIDQNARIILEKISAEIGSLYFYRYEKKTVSLSTEKKTVKKKLAFDGKNQSLKFISSSRLSEPDEQNNGLKEVSISISELIPKKGRSLYITEKMLDFTNPLEENNSENINEFSDQISDISFRYFLIKKSTNVSGKTTIAPGYWADFYKEEENNTLDEEIKTFISIRGVEVSLALFGRDDNGNIDEARIVHFPPLVIPVHSENVITFKKPDEQL